MRSYPCRARRGVLLLVILALLAMFGLVAVAFVLATGHAMRSARAVQRIGQYDTRPREDLDQGFLQAVRGSNNPASVMGPLSLLEDIYGQVHVNGLDDDSDGSVDEPDEWLRFEYSISDAPIPIAGGQLIEFTIPGANRWLGCVLTMRTGPAAAQSTRIVGINPTNGKCQMLAFTGAVPNPGDGYFINGTPFSGTGFGFNRTTGKLDAVSSSGPLALLPNDPLNRHPPGGANEDYDAVDFQNMLLGAQIVDPGTGRVATIPSLHRPALVQYWMNNADWGNANLRRRVMLRPLPVDHPDFDGSNPNFNPVWDGVFVDGDNDGICDYAWDVDNDGDGEPDGIWVDLGLPVRSMPDGRRYKPLFSILCVDLDGRLNLNAHGCLKQADPAYYGPAALQGNYRFAGAPAPRLPRGQGYGPADVNLRPLFSDLAGYGNLLAARYGAPGVPGGSGDDPLSWNKSFQYRDQSMGNFWTFLSAPLTYRSDAYGSPPNWKGQGVVGLDVAGRPLYWGLNTPLAWEDEQVDDPYESDLSAGRAHSLSSTAAPVDNAFGVAELERLLRPFDRDASGLPGRLSYLTQPPGPADSAFMRLLRQRRQASTTESWDLPCPNVVFSKQALMKGVWQVRWNAGAGGTGQQEPNPVYSRLGSLPPPRHLSDVLIALLIKKGVEPAAAPGLLSQLFPPEMLAGLKMDLNRPFGDGRDNNANNVVDEPLEANEQLTLYNRPGGSVAVDFSYDTDGNPGDSLWARQLHARYLYVLMLLLMDEEHGMPKSPPASPQEYQQLQQAKQQRARAVAQWAVNVVDFRDRDSIMTLFPYDPDPFDGGDWKPEQVVFGCERPELLITETLAFHDRRTENLAANGGEYEAGHKGTEEGYDDNDNYDQRIRPQGSLFIELLNPWTNLEPPPGELAPIDRDRDGNPDDANGDGKLDYHPSVDLARMTGNSPVWRLVIAVPAQAGKTDPDDPIETKRPEIERSIYFRDPSGAANLTGDGRRYYPDPTNLPPLAPILPGRYAVIGPDEKDGGPTYSTHMGFKTAGEDDPSLRRIVLTPNLDPDVQQVAVMSDGAADDLSTVAIQPAVAVVINPPGIPGADGTRPMRLSVSERTDGYPVYDPANANATEYNPIQDDPADETDAEFGALWIDGTTPLYRIVYLQRLANPLLEHHPQLNPYRTIDWMQIDLTAFNGVASYTSGDPKADPAVTAGEYKFFTRERGEKEEKAAPPPDPTNNLWAHEQPNPLDAPPKSANPLPAPADDRFSEAFAHTLGYLNEGFQPLYTPTGPGDIYAGSPQTAFPWLTWNNRPFISQLELLLVPTTRSIELLSLYGFSPGSPEPYAPTAPQNVPFPHLLNFFHSDKSGAASPEPPQFHRLLEYVHVPSRFVGTELQGNPTVFAAGGSHSFHPPFSRISRYREPGRINLNTIFSPDVWLGLLNYFPDMNAASPTYWRWGQFCQSRQGYAAGNVLAIDPAYPTRFARPFRSFAGGEMVPLDGLKPRREIDATLLRSDAVALSETSEHPLLAFDTASAAASIGPVNDPNRNPYFRYQGLQRLGNLVTTRSNVYAIWITVGYFEVDAVPVDVVHPDGYALGPELGIETGEVRRHRAFYIIDRSIPVGFRRGQDLNVEKAVLLRRFIE